MDDEQTVDEGAESAGVFMLVRIDGDERHPYQPFSARCGCGCGGVRGSCCCSSH